MSTAEMTPTRSDAASSAHLRTPGSAGPISSPDPSQLVERLQALKSRLSNMTKTLEQSVAAASPLRGKSNEEILYSTPKLVTQLLEGPLGQDAALFLEPGQAAAGAARTVEKSTSPRSRSSRSTSTAAAHAETGADRYAKLPQHEASPAARPQLTQ